MIETAHPHPVAEAFTEQAQDDLEERVEEHIEEMVQKPKYDVLYEIDERELDNDPEFTAREEAMTEAFDQLSDDLSNEPHHTVNEKVSFKTGHRIEVWITVHADCKMSAFDTSSVWLMDTGDKPEMWCRLDDYDEIMEEYRR